MKIGIINYGMGNLGSVRRAFIELGASAVIVHEPATLKEMDKIILPGVGGFNEGYTRLTANGWNEVIRELVVKEGKHLLGICLGMQLLASIGEEGVETPGLNLIPGRVSRLDKLGCNLRIPHIGWNEVELKKSNPLFNHIQDKTDFYFVHSYTMLPVNANHINASVHYGTEFVAGIAHNNIFGVQFHPEKSSKAGLQLLKNFVEY